MRNTRALMSSGFPDRLMVLVAIGMSIGVSVIPMVWTLNSSETSCLFPVFEELTGDLHRPKIIPANATCVWSVVPKPEYIESWTKNEPLLVFKSVVLEPGDRLSIVDSYGDVIFGPYPGDEVPFSILPRILHFSVVVNTSQHVTNHRRHLWAFIDMKERSYTHHLLSENGESVLESPVYATRALFELTRITYKIPSHRNRAKISNLTKLAVVFEAFNFTGDTYMQVSGSQGSDGRYHQEGPPDLIVPSSGTLVLTLFLDCSEADQRFRILLRPTSSACSETVLLDEEHSQRIISFSGESLAASIGSSNPVICTHVIKCPKKSLIRMTILEEVRLASALDLLAVNEAGSMLGSNILLITTGSSQRAKGRVIISSTEYIWLYYSSPSFAPRRKQTNISMMASLEKFGGIYRVPSGGSVNISYFPEQIDFSRSLVPDVTFLLEVIGPPSNAAGSDDILIATFPLPFETGSESAVWIYPSHNEHETAPAAILKDLQTSGHRVLVSSSRAMIVLKKFSNVQAFLANFTAVPKALEEADETSDNASETEPCTGVSDQRNSSDDVEGARPKKEPSSEPIPDRYSGIPFVLMSAGGGFLLGVTLTAALCCAKAFLRRRRRGKSKQRLEESVHWKPQHCYDD